MNITTTVGMRLGGRRVRSFTLIELLVVMSVIVILASIALPVVAKIFGHGEATKCVANVRQIGFGYQSYVRDNDSWMVCAGNKDGEHWNTQDLKMNPKYGTPEKGAPVYELPWFNPIWNAGAD